MGTSIEYQMAHPGEDRGQQTVVIDCCVFALAVTAVILRFLSRYIVRLSVKADDWTLLLGLFFTAGHVALGILSVHYGFGKHAIFVSDRTSVGKTQILNELVYNLAIPSIKISVMLLFARLFPSPRFLLILKLVGAFVLAYSLAQIITILVQCIPLRAVSDPWIPAHCINFGIVLIVMGVFNIITNLVILALPVPILWGLEISKTKRLQLIGIFFLGGIVCIISIIRTVVVSQVSLIDPTWDDVPVATWSVVELAVGIISACLPTYRPLYNRLRHGSAITETFNGHIAGTASISGLAKTHPTLNSKSTTQSQIRNATQRLSARLPAVPMALASGTLASGALGGGATKNPIDRDWGGFLRLGDRESLATNVGENPQEGESVEGWWELGVVGAGATETSTGASIGTSVMPGPGSGEDESGLGYGVAVGGHEFERGRARMRGEAQARDGNVGSRSAAPGIVLTREVEVEVDVETGIRITREFKIERRGF